jgi:VanZ family protein
LKKFLQNSRWAVLWGLFLVLLHVIPGNVFPRIPHYLDLLKPDKLLHAALFAVFVFLLAGAFRKEGSPSLLRRYPALAAVITALLFGAILELVQHYLIPNRFGSVYDEIANAVGCLAGLLITAAWRHR